MAGNTIGLYFGPTIISLVEASGKKVVNSAQIQRSQLVSSDLEEKVPDEIKMVALFKEELRKSNITAKDASLSLSGKDLIIRTFEIPALPANEIPSVINFEVKKYIPFKIEDLVSDFQVQLDRASRRNHVLYVGIKKETLDKYLSIMTQLDIKLNTIEYSGFSVLRFLKMTNFSNSGIVGVISMDLIEEDEINFTVLENGFPLFSRDITLIGAGPEEMPKLQEASPAGALEKIKSEVRVSLDYYHRKFLSKKIAKTYLICNEQNRSEMQSFLNETGLPGQFIDAAKALGKGAPYSLSFIKSYGASLSKSSRTNIKIDLLAAKIKVKTQKPVSETPQLDINALFAGAKVDPKFIILGILICIATFGYGLYLKLPMQNQLNQILSSRPKIPGINPEAAPTELKDINQGYIRKIEALKDVITKQKYATDSLDAIPRLTPKEMRLTNIYYKKNEKDKYELVINGTVFLGELDKELKMVNAFAADLMNDAEFKKNFKEVTITNIEQRREQKVVLTEFSIVCSE